MAFPDNWPPQTASGNRSIRAFVTDTTTANFSDNAYIFIDLPGANTYTTIPSVTRGSSTPVSIGSTPGSRTITQICANTIQVTNDGSDDIEISFDGTNVHGIAFGGETICWRDRREAGIAVRSPIGSSSFRIEAW